MLKRAGRGHDPGGVDNTGMGELAVECPACPQPQRNLPNNWQDSSAATMYGYPALILPILTTMPSWLYTLFIMVDANFKLKLKDKGIPDAHLGSGWAYFVKDDEFGSYLQAHAGDQVEVYQCSKCIASSSLINL